jgi:hypothetical protein
MLVNQLPAEDRNQWVAMYGDCVHRVKPVLSGTRVALIFDLHMPKDSWDLRPVNEVLECKKRKNQCNVKENDRLLREKVEPDMAAKTLRELEAEMNGFDTIAIALSH